MNSKLDDAARAGWLYFVAGNTQDEIARKLGVSRQSAQRLVSTAVSEKLVRVTLEHPIARCMSLGREVAERYGIGRCEVVPSDPEAADPGIGVPFAAAAEMMRWLGSSSPIVMGLGTGRTMRASVERLAPMACEQHKLVSLVGNISADGSGSFYDVISQMAVRVRARHYPMPLPVIAGSAEERAVLSRLATVRAVTELAGKADVSFVGVGSIDSRAPLLEDGFVLPAEIDSLLEAGAVGEIIGWAFDREGKLIPGQTNARVTSFPLRHDAERQVVGVAAGARKAAAIRGALRGGLLTGLITDEITAEKLLEG